LCISEINTYFFNFYADLLVLKIICIFAPLWWRWSSPINAK
jgi:hypothetical protein